MQVCHMFQKLIFLIAKQYLKPIHNLASHPLYSEYLNYLPILEKCYQRAHYWHGTGRYHYKPRGKSKYEGVDNSQTYDILESIVDAGGITPKYDPFISVNGGFGETISLTPYRMYARAYALFNMFEETNLQYLYGTSKFWYCLLLPLQILEWGFTSSIKRVFKIQKDKNSINKYKVWFDTFRKETNWSILNFHAVRSDIPHNYGLLFGIKKEGVQVVHFDPAFEHFETRANNLIKLSDLTHIEVPLNKVDTTTELLERKKINLIVIPLEIGEIYCNKFSLEKLSGVD